MSSAIIAGYTIDCNKNNVGGLKVVRIASKCDIDTITEVAGIITAIAMKPTKKFYEFQLVKSTSNFTLTPTVNAQNGTAYYAEALTLVFNKISAATSAIVDSLVKSGMVAIVEDKNGEVMLLGRTLGLDVSGGSITSGTASGDRNGYDVQLAGEEPKISHVDPTIIAALVA